MKTKQPKPDTKTREELQQENLRNIGACAMSSIREMVAALECDYARLEELRDSKSNDNDNDGERTISDEELKELAVLEEAAGDCESREDAEQRILDDPLSLEFRSGWYTSRDELAPEEFRLLLGTGGPAVMIVGELENGEPTNVRLQTQDWFTPWTDYQGTRDDNEALLTYCRCFYFDN